MNQRETGRERGRKAARIATEQNLPALMQREFRANWELFPSLGPGFDFAAGVIVHDRKRLDCTPDYARFPEMHGLADRARGEREGFMESSGFDETLAAFHFSWGHYIWKHISCRHVARYDIASRRGQCTNVFFPDGKDGVTVADNRDDLPVPWYQDVIPRFKLSPVAESQNLSWIQGTVSNAILLDEEPACIFPCDPIEFMPNECLEDIEKIVAYMNERADFWGPFNQIWVDRAHRAVAVEKANVRAAYHRPESCGAVCITSGSYRQPELRAWKQSRLSEVARLKGQRFDECLDVRQDAACEQRNARLWQLTNSEAARPGGATLWGALKIVADTGVPFPARICLAGEKLDPLQEPNANWTLTQHAAVLTGPRRRGLYRSVQDMGYPRPVYEEIPKLVLGQGVEMTPEWASEIAAGQCISAAEA